MKNRQMGNRHYGKDLRVNIRKWPQNPHFYGCLALLLPVLIVLIAYIAMGVFPFGDQAAMIIDSYHQYVPFFSELHDKIWHGDRLLYSAVLVSIFLRSRPIIWPVR